MESALVSRVTPLRETDPELIRIPPYNNDAEQALLGALLISNAAYSSISALQCMPASMPRLVS
jgi:hypothetical protein